MNETISQFHCSDCAYFIQHYVRQQSRFVKIYAGHCIQGALRNKKPDAPACSAFKRYKPGIRNPLTL